MKKRIISMALSVIFLISFTTSAFAASTSEPIAYEYLENDVYGCDVYTFLSSAKNVIIVANDDHSAFTVSIIYAEQPNTIHEWISIELPEDLERDSSRSLWEKVIDYAESIEQKANTVSFQINSSSSISESIQSRSSAAVTILEKELTALEGSGYNNSIVCTRTYNNLSFRVLEDKVLRVNQIDEITWQEALTIGGIILTLATMGSSGVIAKISSILGVAMGLSSLIPSGSMARYSCSAVFGRRTSINGSSYPYNTTYKYITYEGFDGKNNETGVSGTGIVADTKLVEYSDSESFFYSCISQTEEAYLVYQVVGQQP